MNKPLRIGTRGSPLALAQANLVRDRLLAAHQALAPEATEICIIKTTGDRILDRPLAEAGGKGLFTKEIEEALLEGSIDLAVHSMKDMPTVLPDGLDVPCLLEREDPRDVFISPKAANLWDLPDGAVVGTASLRRQAQILHRRPDLKMVNIRGNVETRLRKIEAGEADATLLALAGLKRLGLTGAATAVIPLEDMLPAVAQGAIGIECRAGDDRILELLAALNHPATQTCIAAERAMLAVLEGSCRTPIAGLAQFDEAGGISLRAMVLTPDGRTVHETSRAGPAPDAERLGRDAGEELRQRAGPNFFAALADSAVSAKSAAPAKSAASD